MFFTACAQVLLLQGCSNYMAAFFQHINRQLSLLYFFCSGKNALTQFTLLIVFFTLG
jgi:hypothetical protein